MEYPIKFILAAQHYKTVSILSDDFPEHINKELSFCKKKQCFVTTLNLPEGIYRYRFQADGEILSDSLRTTKEIAILEIGSSHNQGVIFDIQKSFVKNNHLVLMIGIDPLLWQQVFVNIQTLKGMQTIHGKSTFIEGSIEYYMFVLDIPNEESIYAFFELNGHNIQKYYGENGLKDNEWSTSPFEIKTHLSEPITPSDITGIYHLATPKSILDFEKYISYFEKFPIDYVSGDISKTSVLRKTLNYFPTCQAHLTLSCLLRDIFLEEDNFYASLGLLGRFAYEYCQDIAMIPFVLSDNQLSFWELSKRNFTVAARGVCFQLLGSMTPKILFGEEIGLYKVGLERSMIWTKTKWNKDLFNLYKKLLKLRKKYPVLRQGRFRFVIQDCNLWGIERYMDGEDSIFIFANHSKHNIVINLTKIMDFNGSIIELLTDYNLKRKKVCTIFSESFTAFKQNNSKKKLSIDYALEPLDDIE
ncbi:MAG: hypothetical protein ACRCWI_05710 [Brevinema sp.]